MEQLELKRNLRNFYIALHREMNSRGRKAELKKIDLGPEETVVYIFFSEVM